MLNKCFSDDHIERLVEKFEEIDTDKTGTITDKGKFVAFMFFFAQHFSFRVTNLDEKSFEKQLE